jgi:hypothetical protein
MAKKQRADSIDAADLAQRFRGKTEDYWRWLARYCPIDKEGKKRKAMKMARPLGFLRGSFYFWRDVMTAAAPEVLRAPVILCAGDMHIENFGSWRDAEGRLVWGVNDFDDAAWLPFASDIVRLGTSALLHEPKNATAVPDQPARAIIEAYFVRMRGRAEPFVLENKRPKLRNLATADGKAAIEFWKELQKERGIAPADMPPRALELLLGALPPGAHVQGTYAPLSGTGSLGRPRYAVLADYRGGYVAREIKAGAPSSATLDLDVADPTADYRALEASAIRVRDPFLQIEPRWIVRRLSPESRKIEMKELDDVNDWSSLLEAMGCELANVHLGSAANSKPLIDWLSDGSVDLLADAAERCAETIRALCDKAAERA